jgi:hypothetical protein
MSARSGHAVATTRCCAVRPEVIGRPAERDAGKSCGMRDLVPPPVVRPAAHRPSRFPATRFPDTRFPDTRFPATRFPDTRFPDTGVRTVAVYIWNTTNFRGDSRGPVVTRLPPRTVADRKLLPGWIPGRRSTLTPARTPGGAIRLGYFCTILLQCGTGNQRTTTTERHSATTKAGPKLFQHYRQNDDIDSGQPPRFVLTHVHSFNY